MTLKIPLKPIEFKENLWLSIGKVINQKSILFDDELYQSLTIALHLES